MKNNKKGSLWAELCIGLSIIGVLAVIFIHVSINMREIAERHYGPSIYKSWVKLTGRSDFTYEEWVAARKAGLITNQVINYYNVNKEKIENE